MSEQIVLRTQVTVTNGPKFDVSRKLQVSAFDKLSAVLAAGEKDVEVEVQPSSKGVLLLVVLASKYGDVSYKVKGSGNPSVVLDQPQVFYGAGLLSLLVGVPETLVFDASNATEEVTVQILVGRDLTP